jgi:hypothetical protein
MEKDLKIEEELKFDTRILRKNLRENLISKKDYEKHLSSLPDESGNVGYIEVYEEEPAFGEDLTFTSV